MFQCFDIWYLFKLQVNIQDLSKNKILCPLELIILLAGEYTTFDIKSPKIGECGGNPFWREFWSLALSILLLTGIYSLRYFVCWLKLTLLPYCSPFIQSPEVWLLKNMRNLGQSISSLPGFQVLAFCCLPEKLLLDSSFLDGCLSIGPSDTQP